MGRKKAEAVVTNAEIVNLRIRVERLESLAKRSYGVLPPLPEPPPSAK